MIAFGQGQTSGAPMPQGVFDRVRLDRSIRIVLRGSRTDLDVSQKELANRIGWTRNQIANLEGGRRSVHLTDFLKIAKALNVDPLTLLNRVLRW